MQRKYDPAQEMETSEAISHSPEWNDLVTCITQLHDRLMIPFDTLQHQDEHHNEVVQGLIKDIEGILHHSGQILVGVSGKVGYGKSATINSLLHMRIARAGALGSQCTVVANEYCGMKPGQHEPFLADVTFFSEEQRHQILTALVHSYYGTANATLTREAVATRASGNPFEQDKVIIALLALFKDQGLPECDNEDAIHRWFADAKPGGNIAIVAELMQWTNDLVAQKTGSEQRQTVTLVASTVDALMTRLEPFDGETRENGGGFGSSVWRLVSKIRIHFSSFLTDAGVCFLDTPELTEDRLTASQHAHTITHAMVVTDVTDAFRDWTVRPKVTSAQRLGTDRALVVITGSDRVDYPQMPNTTRRQKDAEAVRRIHSRSREQGKWFQERLSDVPVFSVSNLHYAEHMEGFDSDLRGPLLTAKDTLIPELRAYLATLSDEARLLGMKQLLESTIPGVLDRLEAFVSDASTAGDELVSLQQRLKGPLLMARAIVDGSMACDFDALWEEFDWCLS